MKFFCIDYGRRRVGIAVSDPMGMLARSKTMIDRNAESDYLSRIVFFIEEENPDELVVGLPLDIDDNETEMSREVRRFVEELKLKLKKEIPINFQDESYSSVKSNSILLQTKSRKKRQKKQEVDKVAACIILQEFLDWREDYPVGG
jgi:putative Holliday junction resolvase